MDVLVCRRTARGSGARIGDRRSVWATEFISDNTLTHAVTELRQALGDDAKGPTSSRPSTGGATA